nr:uncharacterized protein C6orf106 homolog [Ciona intestinalis]|eukprot:XP_002127436.1 uncharacterized protein C6orf106 homolog [Ciona intestinalis]
MEETEGVMDVDQCLVGKFSSMGTTDKDVLIDEFRKLLGFQLNAAGCEFFLDMTNWNLHAAIGAYYDFEMPSSKIPSMSFVSDITIGEGEAIPPGTDFIKTWRFQNSGVEKWPLGCTLRFVNGERMSSPEWISVGEVQPHETVDVSVKMRSPINAGLYQGQWRMFTRGMAPFGDIIWVIISVEVGGLLGVTQQMSQFSTGTNNQHQLNTTQNNPFAVDGLGANMDVNVSFGSNNGGQTFDEVPRKCERGTAHDVSSCWETKSPTLTMEEGLGGEGHTLCRIDEETTNDGNNNEGVKYLSSKSSYDLAARQASPFTSPSKLVDLERSFSTPDAPSPIHPTTNLLSINFQETPKAAQRLDFSSNS